MKHSKQSIWIIGLIGLLVWSIILNFLQAHYIERVTEELEQIYQSQQIISAEMQRLEGGVEDGQAY